MMLAHKTPGTPRRSNSARVFAHHKIYPARKAAGREDLRWHDLRHPGAAMRYPARRCRP